MNDTVLLDANVLVPVALCDLLLRTAEAGLFAPRWTDEILHEVRRAVAHTLLKRGLDPHDFTASVDRRIEHMTRSFPKATVTEWEPLAARLTLPDPDDRHVLAAAMRGRAAVIVTDNLRDFPAEALRKGMRAISADDFLLTLLTQSATEVTACVQAQSEESGKYGKPVLDVDAVLSRLTPSAPRFVAAVREQLDR